MANEINVSVKRGEVKSISTEVKKASGGVSDYTSLTNKPKINGIELDGDKTTEELGIDIDTSNFATKDEISGKADKSEIPTVPTNVSAFKNDKGYLTKHQDISGKADKSDTYTKAEVDGLIQDNSGGASLNDIAVAGDGIVLTNEPITSYSVVGSPTISEDYTASGFVSNSSYLSAPEKVSQQRGVSFEIGTAITANSLPTSAANGRFLTAFLASNVSTPSYMFRVNTNGTIVFQCGSVQLTTNTTFVAGTKIFVKVLFAPDTGYSLHTSTDGVVWAQEASSSNTTPPRTAESLFYIGRYSPTISVHLQDTYVQINGKEEWRAVDDLGKAIIKTDFIQSETAPTNATPGYIGQIYVDTATGTGYMCVGVSGSTYTWKQITA